jgi:large conductance mechanosensitive channel
MKGVNFVKKIINEFKEFINRGNVVDMAVGVMIGAAFKAIVDSVVKDLISPVIGIIFKQDFNNLKWILQEEVKELVNGVETVTQPGVSINYGAFIMAIINFLIIAAILFIMVKAINTARTIGSKKVEEAPAAPTTKICPHCKSEIAIDATRCAHCTSEL